MINAGKHHSCDGNNGFFLAAPFGDALIFDCKVCFLFVFDSGKGTLDQQGIQVLSGF